MLFLWATVNVKRGGRHFRFAYAFPLFTLMMLADIAEDIMVPVGFFVSRAHPTNSGFKKWMSAESVRSLPTMLKTIVLQLMIHTGPTELADIEAKGARVRCGLK